MSGKRILGILVLFTGAAAIVGASAPAPGDPIARGKQLFREAQCETCHSLTAIKSPQQAGPALLGVTSRPGRTKEWMVKWISEPDSMLQSDPLAKKLLAENANVPMTPMLKMMTLGPDGRPDLAAVRVKAEALYAMLKDNDAKANGGSAAAPAAKPKASGG